MHRVPLQHSKFSADTIDIVDSDAEEEEKETEPRVVVIRLPEEMPTPPGSEPSTRQRARQVRRSIERAAKKSSAWSSSESSGSKSSKRSRGVRRMAFLRSRTRSPSRRPSAGPVAPEAPHTLFPPDIVPIIETIQWYQWPTLNVLQPRRNKVVYRGQKRRLQHEALCIGLGTELYSYEASTNTW